MNSMDVPDHEKQTKSADELAALIHGELVLGGCPKAGVKITV
jgi:hypothetical protein